MIIITGSRKKENQVHRFFDVGDSAKLLTYEALPERHISRDFYIHHIEDNPQKMQCLGTEVVISKCEFSSGLGEWLYYTDDNNSQHVWLEDMFFHAPHIVSEKGQSNPQMPDL